MKYYKVVRKEKRGLFSCLVPSHNRFRRRYKKGEWTEARKGSLLFVFSSREAAVNFVCLWSRVWECKVDGVEGIISIAHYWDSFSQYKDFWGKKDRGTALPANATVGAKRVKLIKEIA